MTLAQHLARCSLQLSKRGIATTCVRASVPGALGPHDISDLTPEQRLKYFPKLGNREIVGPGVNGHPIYLDRLDFPMPAVRWAENTPEVLQLREKEKGDWKNLTMEDKKALYRSSFRQTFAEFRAPSGEWRSIMANVFWGLSASGLLFLWCKLYVMGPPERTINKEWNEANLERMIQRRFGGVESVSSHWDYEKNQWK